MTVPPELEMETKQNYKGKCVITGFDSAWGPLIAGPGIETCHIVPKAMFDWYGYPDIEMSSQQQWDAVNSPDNCITMESFSHTIHDNRLLAIHPVSMSAPYPGLLVTLNRFPTKSDSSHLSSR